MLQQFLFESFFMMTHPISVYGSYLLYFYGFWLVNLVTAFYWLFSAQKLSRIKFPWWLYLVNFLLMSILVSSPVLELSYLAINIVLTYLFISHRTMSITTLATYFIVSVMIIQFTMTFIGATLSAILAKVAPAYQLDLKHFLEVPILLVELTTTLLIINFFKLNPKLNTYLNTVSKQAPLLVWGVNIFLYSFKIFTFSGIYGLSNLSTWQYEGIAILYIICFTLICRYSTRYFKYQTLATSEQIELENLQTYTSHIEELYDDLRRFRHDYQNILLSLGTAIQAGDLPNIQAIYKQTVIPTQAKLGNQTAVLSHLANIKDLEIKSLVYSKTMQAINAGIEMEIEVVDPIKLNPQINSLDAVRIIAILFDNAINAAKQADTPKINFSLFTSQDNQYIIIGNSTKEEQVNLRQTQGNFSSLGKRHSLGLRNLKIILARYPFIQHNTQSNQHWFKQTIIIHD